MPGPDGPGFSTAGGSSLVIFRRSPRKLAAWQLIEFLSEPTTMQRFHALTGNLPPRRSAWRAPELAADLPSRAFARQLERVRAAPKIPEWERIFQEMQLAAERVVQRTQTIDAATTQLDAWVDALLEKRRWLRARALAAVGPR
jgi:multiple sugar transport system substrate-binding protein